eukprot:TRINITY_DN22057_c0_g1_i1.p1 TRINITY_DN22057_c0_g1~~TRINITY_DN22057_c0_g1_i1.p1  ORF type:complete len:436 (-),score=102.71 TRINITY_DN22057_c0_g1_i1:622-1929(-)
MFSMQLLRKLRKDQHAPNVVTYNVLINASARSMYWESALSLLSTMARTEVEADLVSFNSAISASEKAWQWPHAVWLFSDYTNRYERQELSSEARAPDVKFLGSVVSACGKGQQWEMALQYQGSAASMRLVPSVIVYSASLAACSESSRWQQVVMLLAEMRKTLRQATAVVSVRTALDSLEQGGTAGCLRRLLPVVRKALVQLLLHASAIGAASRRGVPLPVDSKDNVFGLACEAESLSEAHRGAGDWPAKALFTAFDRLLLRPMQQELEKIVNLQLQASSTADSRHLRRRALSSRGAGSRLQNDVLERQFGFGHRASSLALEQLSLSPWSDFRREKSSYDIPPAGKDMLVKVLAGSRSGDEGRFPEDRKAILADAEGDSHGDSEDGREPANDVVCLRVPVGTYLVAVVDFRLELAEGAAGTIEDLAAVGYRGVPR